MAESNGNVIPEKLLAEAKSLFSRYPPTKSLIANLDLNHADAADDSKLIEHILKYKKEAYAAHPYNCIAFFLFLHSNVNTSPIYESIILPKLRAPSSALFMDVGCGFGQEIRSLVADGAEPTNLIGFDLRKEFIEYGYGLFRDGPDTETPLKSTFITGSIFDDDNDLTQYHDRIDIIQAGSFLHLFSWEAQIEAANRLDKLLKSEPGAIIMGAQAGVKRAGVLETVTKTAQAIKGQSQAEGQGEGELSARVSGHSERSLGLGTFRHNAETFKDFWKNVGDGKWNVDVTERTVDVDLEKNPLRLAIKGETILALRFIVTRV